MKSFLLPSMLDYLDEASYCIIAIRNLSQRTRVSGSQRLSFSRVSLYVEAFFGRYPYRTNRRALEHFHNVDSQIYLFSGYLSHVRASSHFICYSWHRPGLLPRVSTSIAVLLATS